MNSQCLQFKLKKNRSTGRPGYGGVIAPKVVVYNFEPLI